jgi:NADH dehydrogenase
MAPGLKSIEEALEIRRRVFTAFEQAEREADPAVRRQLMTFVVVGGGPTGVELAGAIAELAHHTLRHDFRSIDTTSTEILLLEGTDRILSAYPPSLSQRAVESLEELGVTVVTNSLVTDIQTDKVTLRRGDELKSLSARTVLWAAGVQASPLGKALAQVTEAELDRQGRVHVEPDLSLPKHPEILVLGDLAHFGHQNGKPLPGVAPVAMQQGRYVAKLIKRRLCGRTLPPFSYRDFGNMAVIGRSAAVAQIKTLRLHGFAAWLAWLFVHLINLVEFENRLLVFLQWGWNYFTRNRSARLITHQAETQESPPDTARPALTAHHVPSHPQECPQQCK